MIAVIADDLSGATELAGLGWRFGLSTEILRRHEPPSNAELLVYDTDSRLCGPREAARRVREAANRLKKVKPVYVYKKVDSVLRGNVLAEIKALCADLGLQGCLLVPANPEAGRIIRNGKYFVGGAPITETDFRHDPVHPRLSCYVRRLLDASAGRGVSTKVEIALLKPGATRLPKRVAVGQAANAHDLRHWVRLLNRGTLPAGGAEFFRAILTDLWLDEAALPGPGSRRPSSIQLSATSPLQSPAPPQAHRTLFVSGSISAASVRFVEQWRRRGLPLFLMPPGIIDGNAGPRLRDRWVQAICKEMETGRQVLMGIGQPLRPGKCEGERLGELLANAARNVVAWCHPDRLCVEGGATAALVLRQLGSRRLVVDYDFAMGVTAVRPHGSGHPQILIKPGSYAWPRQLCPWACYPARRRTKGLRHTPPRAGQGG